MIISVHIPKTAGTSFGEDLNGAFGARLFADYGDWPEVATPEGQAHNEQRRAEVLARLDEIAGRFDAIHGHFTAGKYLNVFSGHCVHVIRARSLPACDLHLRPRDA
jgi:hypothetical protein